MKTIIGTHFPLLQISKHFVSAAVLATCALAMPKAAEAVSFDLFLIAEHTDPTSSTAPLSVTTERVFQLSGYETERKLRATSAEEVTSQFSFDIDQALSFASNNDPASGPGGTTDPWRTDQGENGAGASGSGVTESYVNSQISTWDNSGISGTTVDADEQLDLGRSSRMTFDAVSGGFTDLLIADLGGLNPFNLSICPDAVCSTITNIFGGFKSEVRDFLVGTGLFATSDTGLESNQDQLWLFRFDEPMTDFVSLIENDNRSIYTGARMQADFVGVKSAGTTGPSPVPGPAGLPLLASGVILLGWARRRNKV